MKSLVDTPDRDLSHLYPPFQKKLKTVLEMVNQHIDAQHERGEWLEIRAMALFEGYRSIDRQRWLFGQGRTRRGQIVTNATVPGVHGFGLAADCAFKNARNQWTWEAPDELWSYFGHCCRVVGLEWAGDWQSFPEQNHCQVKKSELWTTRLLSKAYLLTKGQSTP